MQLLALIYWHIHTMHTYMTLFAGYAALVRAKHYSKSPSIRINTDSRGSFHDSQAHPLKKRKEHYTGKWKGSKRIDVAKQGDHHCLCGRPPGVGVYGLQFSGKTRINGKPSNTRTLLFHSFSLQAKTWSSFLRFATCFVLMLSDLETGIIPWIGSS